MLLALSQLQTPAYYSLALFAICIVDSIVAGGGPFIVLRSCGISQINHTYGKDSTHISSATVVTSRCSRYVTMVAEDIRGAYPPSIPTARSFSLVD